MFETKIIQIKLNRVKNSNWLEANQLAILQPRLEFELCTYWEQFQLAVRASELQVHSSALFALQCCSHLNPHEIEASISYCTPNPQSLCWLGWKTSAWTGPFKSFYLWAMHFIINYKAENKTPRVQIQVTCREFSMTLCLLSHKEVKEDTCQKKWKPKNKHAKSGQLSLKFCE